MDFTSQRNYDFLATCHHITSSMLDSGETLSVNEIIRRAIRSPAPSYYVTYTYAYRHVGRYLRGLLPMTSRSGARSVRRQLIAELALKCRQLLDADPSLSLSTALARVLSSETASSYFITFHTARRLYYDTRRAMHRRGERLRSRRLL